MHQNTDCWSLLSYCVVHIVQEAPRLRMARIGDKADTDFL